MKLFNGIIVVVSVCAVVFVSTNMTDGRRCNSMLILIRFHHIMNGQKNTNYFSHYTWFLIVRFSKFFFRLLLLTLAILNGLLTTWDIMLTCMRQFTASTIQLSYWPKSVDYWWQRTAAWLTSLLEKAWTTFSFMVFTLFFSMVRNGYGNVYRTLIGNWGWTNACLHYACRLPLLYRFYNGENCK